MDHRDNQDDELMILNLANHPEISNPITPQTGPLGCQPFATLTRVVAVRGQGLEISQDTPLKFAIKLADLARLAAGENSILQSKIALQGIERDGGGTTCLESLPSQMTEVGIFQVIEVVFDEAPEIEGFGSARFHG